MPDLSVVSGRTKMLECGGRDNATAFSLYRNVDSEVPCSTGS